MTNEEEVVVDHKAVWAQRGSVTLRALVFGVAPFLGFVVIMPEYAVSQWPGKGLTTPFYAALLPLVIQVLFLPVWVTAQWVRVASFGQRPADSMGQIFGAIVLVSVMMTCGATARLLVSSTPWHANNMEEFVCRYGVVSHFDVPPYPPDAGLEQLHIDCSGTPPVVSASGQTASILRPADWDALVARVGDHEARFPEFDRDVPRFEPVIWETRDGQQILVFADREQALNWYPDAYANSRPVSLRELQSVMTWFPGGVLRAASMSINWSLLPIILQFAAVGFVCLVQLSASAVRRATTRKE